MTDATRPPRAPAARVALGLALAAALAAGAWLALGGPGGSDRAYAAPGLDEPVPAAALSENSFRVIPVLLQQVYTAFGETDEAAIYDGLATVAAEAALETLYLERVGAIADAGLEPDQQIHEMELLSLTSRPGRGQVDVSATWRVLGTVGHAEHLHVRGNAYSADLVLQPVDAAWRLTGFSLRNVDRTEAGTLTEKVDGPWAESATANTSADAAATAADPAGGPAGGAAVGN
jgi:hypothetical protein